MHCTSTAPHPDERLLQAVRQLGDWLAADQRTPAKQRLALMLDAPVCQAILADLGSLDLAAA